MDSIFVCSVDYKDNNYIKDKTINFRNRDLFLKTASCHFIMRFSRSVLANA